MNFKIIVIFLILLTSCVNNTEKQRSEILSINNKFYKDYFSGRKNFKIPVSGC